MREREKRESREIKSKGCSGSTQPSRPLSKKLFLGFTNSTILNGRYKISYKVYGSIKLQTLIDFMALLNQQIKTNIYASLVYNNIFEWKKEHNLKSRHSMGTRNELMVKIEERHSSPRAVVER